MLKLYRFTKQYRLRKPEQIKTVFADQARIFTKYFVLYYRHNQENYPRLGIIISKRNVKYAVGRSRIKRQIRETFRLHKAQCGDYDMIVIAKKLASQTTNCELSACLSEVFVKQLGC